MPDWDQVYQQKSVGEAQACSVLSEHAYLLPSSGTALDYASGLGGNAKMLAASGLQAQAWDLSAVAVEKINRYALQHDLALSARQVDLESQLVDELAQLNRFDVIVVSFFLHRSSLKALARMLKPGGLLFYQTFCGKQLNGIGPSREAFRLKRGELLKTFDDLQLVFYREDPEALAGQSFQGVEIKPEQVLPDQVLFVARK